MEGIVAVSGGKVVGQWAKYHFDFRPNTVGFGLVDQCFHKAGGNRCAKIIGSARHSIF